VKVVPVGITIPDDEKEVIAANLAENAGEHMARFIKTIATRPPQ
jgi:hypothetical protein